VCCRASKVRFVFAFEFLLEKCYIHNRYYSNRRNDAKPTPDRSLLPETIPLPSFSVPSPTVFLANLEPPLVISQYTGRRLVQALRASKTPPDRPQNGKGKSKLDNGKETEPLGLIDLIVSELAPSPVWMLPRLMHLVFIKTSRDPNDPQAFDSDALYEVVCCSFPISFLASANH
jgi:hypothetical protein